MDPATIAMLAKVATTVAPYAFKGLSQGADVKNAKAYQDYLNNFASGMSGTLQDRAAMYEGKLGGMSDLAEGQFMQEANTPLAELGKVQSDIANQSAEAQRQNRLQVENQLNSLGVRGGQAAILANRATGELNRDLQRDVNQLGYNEASNRQGSRLNYLSQKAYSPWATLSDTYGSNARSASGYLSQAQGNALSNAYNTALGNYRNTRGRGLF